MNKIVKMKGTVLIVDDNREVLTRLEKIVHKDFDKVITLSNPNRIIEIGRASCMERVLI